MLPKFPGNKKWILFLPLLLPFQDFAQQTLTLNEAIDRALKNNYQIQISKANVDISKINNNWGQAGALPSLNYNLTNANAYNFVDNPASFLRGEYMLNSLRNNIDLSWTVFNGFRMWAAKDRLDKLEEFSSGNAAVVVENTIQAVILTYNRALLEKERLEVLRTVLVLSKDRYHYMRERQKLGSAVTFDVLLVKNAMLTDSAAVMLQQVNYNNSLRALNLILAEDISTRFVPADSLVPITAVYDPDQMRQKMLENNRTLRNQFVNMEILRKEVKMLQSEQYPRINLNGGYNYSDNWINHENFQGHGNARDYYANFTLSFNLFNGGRSRNAIQTAKIQERIAKLGVNEMEQTMLNQLYQLLELYNARTAILAISLENMQAAEINLNLSKEKFRTGTINSFDYRDVQLNYMNAAQQYLSAIYDQIETNTELIRLSGGIISE